MKEVGMRGCRVKDEEKWPRMKRFEGKEKVKERSGG